MASEPTSTMTRTVLGLGVAVFFALVPILRAIEGHAEAQIVPPSSAGPSDASFDARTSAPGRDGCQARTRRGEAPLEIAVRLAEHWARLLTGCPQVVESGIKATVAKPCGAARTLAAVRTRVGPRVYVHEPRTARRYANVLSHQVKFAGMKKRRTSARGRSARSTQASVAPPALYSRSGARAHFAGEAEGGVTAGGALAPAARGPFAARRARCCRSWSRSSEMALRR